MLAAPVVLPLAAVILVGLTEFWIAEAVVWAAGRLVGRPAETVPAPGISWRL